jgi:hypothetical protein
MSPELFGLVDRNRRGDVGRHAGEAGENRPRSPQTDLGAGETFGGGGTAVLTDPRGLPSAFGHSGPLRRLPSEFPAIGTPEHTALLSGSLDLAEMFAAQGRAPLVGFAPVVLDPAGPSDVDRAQRGDASARRGDDRRGPGRLPSRRSLRSGRGSSLVARGGVPTPRAGIGLGGVAGSARPGSRPMPPLVTGLPLSGPVADHVRADLASLPVMNRIDDPTPTGELARPFVNETSLAEWVTLDDVPPPVSVDVFQKAVRAGLTPEVAAAAIAASPNGELPVLRAAETTDAPEATGKAAVEADTSAARRRTRREQRARERALCSLRGVTARRLAKGGVLAITALGVVSSANPQTLGALGLDSDTLANSQGVMDFAGALAPRLTPPVLSPEALAQRQMTQRARSLRHEMNDEAADNAANASTMAGQTLLSLAFQQDAALESRREAARRAAARDAIRDPRKYAAILVQERGWSAGQFQCLDRLWTRESNWNYRASNPSTGAGGIAQALPANKQASVGADYRTNPITQIKWGLNYIESRYGSPCGAWAHSQGYGWY